MLLNNRTVVGVDWGAWAMRWPAAQKALLGDLLDRIADGSLHPPAPHERPLDDAGAVLRDLLDRRTRGKIVLVP